MIGYIWMSDFMNLLADSPQILIGELRRTMEV